MILENKVIWRKELKINLHFNVWRLILNKFKEIFPFKEELSLNLSSDELRLIFIKYEKKRVFAQVCRSWNLIADDEIFWLLRSYKPKSILLLLPDRYESSIVYIAKFGYDMFRDKGEKIKKREVSFIPSQIEIIDSCRCGWIFLSDKNTKDLKLWSPLFNVKIRLPHFPFRIIKAVTFFGNDFGIGVIVIYESRKLAFVKYGDLEWSYLCRFEAKEAQYDDLISSKDLIIALSTNEKSIHAWNFEGKNILNVKFDFPPDMEETNKYKYKLYITESKGRVFLVVRWLQLSKNIYSTVNFYVYVLDEEKKVWSRLESLGAEALFVGKNQTMLLPTKDFEGCQKNSIYFAGHPWETFPDENWWSGELYGYVIIFSLEDSTIQKYRRGFFNTLFSCWIISNV